MKQPIPLLTAARALLDAMGSNPPDWLAKEAADLEQALNSLYAPEWPGGIQTFKPFEMVTPEGRTLDEMRAHIHDQPLYQRGDTVLRWVNEGDTWPAPLVMPGMRVESGPVQFGDDWPGLWLRGDSCFAYSLALKAERSQNADAFSRAGVDGLITALESTNINRRGASSNETT